jgi:hypothetical protein
VRDCPPTQPGPSAGRPREEAAIALNRDRIGHRYPVYHYEVSREKIREFALATGAHDSLALADPAEVPLADVVAPPTFAACFTLGRGEVLGDPELGLHWNLVHGSQSFELARPIRGGDVLACTPTIVDIVDRGRMELLTYAIECLDATSGDPVVTSTATLILFSAEEA